MCAGVSLRQIRETIGMLGIGYGEYVERGEIGADGGEKVS